MSQRYTPAPDLLRERVILVTGAGSGIGRAVARACAAHGASVVLVGRTLRKLEAVYDEIEAAGHATPAIIPFNLESATPKDYADLAVAINSEFGRLDGLVHNAAQLGALSPVVHYEHDMWNKVLQVNLTAPFLLTQALLGLLSHAPDASLVFTTDPVGQQGRAYWGAYGVSKAGADSLMRILANEWENSGTLRVNALDPGQVRSQVRINAYPAGNREQWVEAEQITPAYLYLLGPDSRGVTGQTIHASDYSA